MRIMANPTLMPVNWFVISDGGSVTADVWNHDLDSSKTYPVQTSPKFKTCPNQWRIPMLQNTQFRQPATTIKTLFLLFRANALCRFRFMIPCAAETLHNSNPAVYSLRSMAHSNGIHNPRTGLPSKNRYGKYVPLGIKSHFRIQFFE